MRRLKVLEHGNKQLCRAEVGLKGIQKEGGQQYGCYSALVIKSELGGGGNSGEMALKRNSQTHRAH